MNQLLQIPILTYHSLDVSRSVVSVSPIVFEQQMAYLYQKGYRTISLGEMINRFGSGMVLSKKSMVLTFDDGFKSVAEEAFPILQKYGFTATVFVATGYAGKACGWAKDNLVSEFSMLTWKQIKHLHQMNFDIQPHTCNHPHLTELTDEESLKEITNSKQEIEKKLNKVCDVFCYPFGDFDDRVISLVKKAGFSGAVSINFGKNNTQMDLFKLNRIGSAYFTNMTRFKACMLGMYDLYRDVKKAIML